MIGSGVVGRLRRAGGVTLPSLESGERGSSPEALGTATRAQLAKYAKLMKQAGIKAE